MQVMLMRVMSKSEYLIVQKGTKFTGSGQLGLSKMFLYNTAFFHRLKISVRNASNKLCTN